MPFIAILGCDGAGKSAVIAGLIERLSEEGEVKTCHWRPRPFGSEVSSAALEAAAEPHGQRPRGLPDSVLKLGWIWLNWWVGWIAGLRSVARRGFLIFDRFHNDMLIDPLRYRYGGPRWLARMACATMPQPDRVVFLDAPVAVLLSRKQEVPADVLEKTRAAYLQLCAGNSRFQVIDATRPLQEVVDEVLQLVRGRGAFASA